MNRYALVGLSVAGGFLSALAWTEWCTGLILLISFVPFILIENHLYINRKKYSPNSFFAYLLPGFLLFSMFTLGWLRVASIVGAISVILGITFIISFTAWLAHIVRLRAGTMLSVLALISFWLSYEYMSLNLDIVTPWVNLGNGLAKDTQFIQWYELTGTAGGTLWILMSNLMLSAVIIGYQNRFRKTRITLTIWILIVLFPLLISVWRYRSIKPSLTRGSEIIIVQPNFDPYTTKFSVNFDKQLQKCFSLADGMISQNTQWIITPETTVDDPINEDNISNNIYVRMTRGFLNKHPSAQVVTGMTTFKLYQPSIGRPTRSARYVDSLDTYYDHFNSALKIDTSGRVEIYHKSKLVPGIEKQFVSGPGKMLTRILPYLGGSQWGYGSQKERGIFTCSDQEVKIAPIICYESVFGKYVTEYVKKGASLLFIITNDGWWKNTNGYEQHLWFACLRAIETRRPVARSGNTGISAFIDFKGNIVSQTGWWEEATLKGTLFPEKRITPYVKYGDWLLKCGIISAGLIILIAFVKEVFRKFVQK
jgi:apolipoprotein N-acyltransferase